MFADFESYQLLVMLFVKIKITNSAQSPMSGKRPDEHCKKRCHLQKCLLFVYNRLGSASLDTNLQIQY